MEAQSVQSEANSGPEFVAADVKEDSGLDFIALDRGQGNGPGKVKVTLEGAEGNAKAEAKAEAKLEVKAEAKAKAKAKAKTRPKDEVRLFVGGLPPDAEDEDLRGHFEKYGKVTEASIIRERDTGRSRNFGFVTLQDLTEISKETVLTTEHELKRKKVSVRLHERDGKEHDRERSPKRRKQKQERTAPVVADIHKKALVDGLSLRTTSEALRRACSRFGAISEVTILKEDDKPTGKAEVLFATLAAARVALQEGAVDVDGRRVAIRPPSGAGSEGQAVVYGAPPSYSYYVQAPPPGFAAYQPGGVPAVTYVYSSPNAAPEYPAYYATPPGTAFAGYGPDRHKPY